MKKARVVVTRALVIKAVAERLEANEGGREEEENGLRDCCSESERLRDLNSWLSGQWDAELGSGFHQCVA